MTTLRSLARAPGDSEEPPGYSVSLAAVHTARGRRGGGGRWHMPLVTSDGLTWTGARSPDSPPRGDQRH